jgi:hypothetical protein
VAVGQSISVLHIKVMLADADGKVTAVPRHALLISDNPASAPPRLVTTETDGTADVAEAGQLHRRVRSSGGVPRQVVSVDTVG